MLFKHNNIHKLGLCFKYYTILGFLLTTWHVPFCHLWALKACITVNGEKIICILSLKFQDPKLVPATCRKLNDLCLFI